MGYHWYKATILIIYWYETVMATFGLVLLNIFTEIF